MMAGKELVVVVPNWVRAHHEVYVFLLEELAHNVRLQGSEAADFHSVQTEDITKEALI